MNLSIGTIIDYCIIYYFTLTFNIIRFLHGNIGTARNVNVFDKLS